MKKHIISAIFSSIIFVFVLNAEILPISHDIEKISAFAKPMQSTAMASIVLTDKAPLNPDYIDYILSFNKGTLKKKTLEGYSLGYIPDPMLIAPQVPRDFVPNTSLPSRFDLRDSSFVSSVKNQGACGSCWTFATCASLESQWIKSGYGIYDLSENNLNHGNGFEWLPCEGGNASLATAYLIRGDGPISEADDPYEETSGSYHEGLTPQAYVTEARRLPQDANVIKQMIYDHGALYTNMCVADTFSNYYNSTDYTYYYDGDENTNHAVTLVGWDDNKTVSGAPGNGAWIIKNSWGASWAENGYFYISYYDSKANSSVAYWPERINYDPNMTIHGYDKLGNLSSFGWSDDTDYGLVKFVFTGSEDITMIGSSMPSGGTIAFDIYNNFDGMNLSGLLASVSPQTCDYPGYYSFNLPDTISVSDGEDLYVKVEYSTTGYQFSIPIECVISGYASPEINAGIFWISNTGSNGSWTAIGSGTSYEYDPTVKLYGTVNSSAISANFSAVPTSGTMPLEVQFSDLSTGSPTSWSWHFGDGDSSAVQNPSHTYLNEGLYTVSLKAMNDTTTDTETKIDYIAVNAPSDTLLNESFETGGSGWSIIDNDNDGNPWTLYSESASGGADLAHSGDIGAGVYYNSSGNDDWLITPALPLPSNSKHRLSFWAKSMDASYKESFNVKLSTTGTALGDFTTTLGSASSVPGSWTLYTYDLDGFADQTVYVAVQCVSVDKYYLLVDDFYCASNQAPSINSISDQFVDQGQNKILPLSGNDPDGDALTFSASSDNINITTVVNSTTLTLTPADGWSGDANIRVKVSDGMLEDSTEFMLTVNRVNTPPNAATLLSPDSSVIETLTPEFQWTAAADPDTDDAIHYQVLYWDELPADTLYTDCTFVSMSSPLIENYHYRWLVIALDNFGGTAMSDICDFWVNAIHEAPSAFTTISPTESQQLENGTDVIDGSVTFLWHQAADNDPFDVVNYELTYRITSDTDPVWQSVYYGLDTNYTLSLEGDKAYEWFVTAIDEDSLFTMSNDSSTSTFALWNVGIDPGLPSTYTLLQNYPNPFNPDTHLRFGIPETADVTMTIYNILGNIICEWNYSNLDPGWYDIIWNGTNMNGRIAPTGIYIFALKSGNYYDTGKMVFMK